MFDRLVTIGPGYWDYSQCLIEAGVIRCSIMLFKEIQYFEEGVVVGSVTLFHPKINKIYLYLKDIII